MGVLIVVGAALLALYGVAAGSGWALGLAALSTSVGMWRLSGERGERDFEVVRRHGAALGSSPWKSAAVSTLALSWIASEQIRRHDPSWSGTGLWVASLVLALVAGVLHDRDSHAWRRVTTQLGWGRTDWLIIGVCTAVAVGLRLYRLDSVLPPMHGDEGEMGTLARLALHGPGGGRGEAALPVFSTGFLDHPTFFHYVQAFSLRVFGDSILGLRLLSVVAGTATVPFVYLIARVGWGKTAAFTASWLLAVSQLHIQYSRIALNNIESLLLIVVTIALLVLAGQESSAATTEPERRMTLFVLIGLTAGLSQYFYYGSRVLAVIVPVVLWQLVRSKRACRRDVGVVVGAGFVAVLPLLRFYAANMPAFFARARGVSVFSEPAMQHELGPDAVWPQDLLQLLNSQVRANLGFFVNRGDASGFYTGAQPSFDQVALLLFWIGLGVVVVQSFSRLSLPHVGAGRSKTAAGVVLTWLLAVVITGGLLTTDSPNSPRLLMMVPAVFILGGAAAQYGRDLCAELGIDRVRWVGVAVAGVLAMVTFSINTDRYFTDYAFSQPTVVIDIANQMAEVPDTTRVLLLGAPDLFVEYGTIRFVAPDRDLANLLETDSFEAALADAGRDGKDLLLMVVSWRIDDLDAIRLDHPGGVLLEHLDQRGAVAYTTYLLKTSLIHQ